LNLWKMMVSKLKCKVVRKGVPGIWGGCICWLLRWRWWARGQRNPMLIVWMAVIEFLSCHTVQHDVYMYYCHSRWDANLSYGHFCSPVLTKRDAWTSYEKQGHGEWCMLYHRDHRSKKTSMCWSLFELLNSKCATTTLSCSTSTVPHHNLSSTNFLPPPMLFHPYHLPCALLSHHLQLWPQRRSCHLTGATLQIRKLGLLVIVRNTPTMRYKTTYLNIRQLKWCSQEGKSWGQT